MELKRKLYLITAVCLSVVLFAAGCGNQTETQAQDADPTPIIKEVVKEVMVTPEPEVQAVPKYVFYLIGDGLGASSVRLLNTIFSTRQEVTASLR